ncbi:MAG: hypothetical protein RBJ76_12205 [Stenomitos frigidus ULC029]
MTELVKDPTERSPDSAAFAASLLHHYGFELGGDTIAQLLLDWQEQYSDSWIRLATIEALYQGRYKAISIEQILALWQRRSQPMYHFNHEFERLVCDRLPHTLEPVNPPAPEPFLTQAAQALLATLPYPDVVSPLAQSEPMVLHNADAMQALRTLHDEADTLPNDRAVAIDVANEPSLLQTYSYTLRSKEPPSQPLAHEQREALRQHPVEQTLLPAAPLPIASAATANHVTQIDLIATTEARSETDVRSEVEQAHATEQAADTRSSSESNSTSTQPSSTAQAASIARILQQLDNQELSTKTMFPGFGLLAHTLKPKLRLSLTARYQPIWLTNPTKQPIHQFTPTPEASDFHSKLKAVAQTPDEVSTVEP